MTRFMMHYFQARARLIACQAAKALLDKSVALPELSMGRGGTLGILQSCAMHSV